MPVPGEKIVAIHQPNFFPWLGYFDKIARAEAFIFLDEVAYPKSGSGAGSWSNRVRINIQGSPAWFGCPVRREPGTQLIRDMRIDDAQPWRKKLLKTLEMNYRRAPRYEQVMPILESLISFESDNLADFNIEVICALCDVLGLKTRFFRQGDLGGEGAATRLLIDLVKKAGSNAYLCGGGASGYQEDHLFAENGIKLIYQDFEPFVYGAPERFLPGLSVIDFLMHEAPEQFATRYCQSEADRLSTACPVSS